jgi:hypothetical protein
VLRTRGFCTWAKENLLVRHDGTVGLCCFDWRNDHNFGNLGNTTLTDTLDFRLHLLAAMEKGEILPVLCKRCRFTGVTDIPSGEQKPVEQEEGGCKDG